MITPAYINLSSMHCSTLISQWCMPEDYAYAQKFKREQRQKQSLAGRCLLRMLFGLFNNPEKVEFHINKSKEGELLLTGSNNEPLWGSISHSHDMVCAVISMKGPVGIDVERINPTRDLTKILGFWDIDFVGDKQTGYKIWTNLEAYGKANGSGITTEVVERFLKEFPNQFLHNEISEYSLSLYASCY